VNSSHAPLETTPPDDRCAPAGAATIEKQLLHDALRRAREDLVRKLDGLNDYDAGRPMTPTGTSLLGLVKHVAIASLGYFGPVFDRDPGVDVVALWGDDEEDMWAQPDQTRAGILELFTRAARVSDDTINALEPHSPGLVPWWPPQIRQTTLRHVLVHMIKETERHAGHADIVRELIDGRTGRYPDDPSMAARTPEQWADRWARIERAARERGA